VKATFRGHAGPVTSLALYTHTTNTTPTQKRKILFTGSWDKTIKTWDIEVSSTFTTTFSLFDEEKKKKNKVTHARFGGGNTRHKSYYPPPRAMSIL
jgi:WD40 repeat protein